MAYRDHPPGCPRCGAALLRRQRRDIWRCPRCVGVQLSAGELERRLRMLAPDISDEVLRDMMTARRSRAAAVGWARSLSIACPNCRRPMHPVAMGGVRVARCEADDQVWVDSAELDRMVDLVGARQQLQRSWLARLFSHLFAS